MSRFSVQEVEVNKKPMMIRNDPDYERAWNNIGNVEARLTRVLLPFDIRTKLV
jgi:hypothetical protein